MPLLKIEHYLVLTDDLEGTRDFYVEALGMHVGTRPPLEFPGYWVYVGDTPCIHIAEWQTYTAHSLGKGIPVTVRAAGTGPVDHIAFHGQDYDDIVARLERRGVAFIRNDRPNKTTRQLFLQDPNGVKIEINVRKS
jgi:catechol 2,3-dioxygenase-like lactoylglutathione lyase family enzyme